MKKKEFDKNIKIISLANKELQGLNLKSILYTPIPYRIPVAFADSTNSADDTKKYIKENYSKEEQENLKYNDKINTAFFNELSKLNKPSEKEAAELAKKYSSKLKAVKYKAPDDLRNITTDDNIDTIKGYFVIDSNALINKNGELLIEFLNSVSKLEIPPTHLTVVVPPNSSSLKDFLQIAKPIWRKGNIFLIALTNFLLSVLFLIGPLPGRWTCRSIKPGKRYWPFKSITLSPFKLSLDNSFILPSTSKIFQPVSGVISLWPFNKIKFVKTIDFIIKNYYTLKVYKLNNSNTHH